MAKGKCIALLGTGSDVGKSFIVAGIGRALKNRGFDVAPYKAQNMSNNSYVTLDGLEMGRAQVVQAEACGLEPDVRMNPVLLKPAGDMCSQVVLQGRVLGSRSAREYYGQIDRLFDKVMESLESLQREHAVVVMEGAGSCGEVNLRDRDIVNFRPAHAVDAPVLLIADIDRGGVFGQIVGTLAVIPPEDRARVRGIIINRFRGDGSLFTDGVRWIEAETGLPVLGVLPFNREIAIDAEDGMTVETVVDPPAVKEPGKIHIACLLLPRISNHTDLAALQCTAGVSVHFLSRPRDLGLYDQVLLPGSKNVRADLDWLQTSGWTSRLERYVAGGGRLGGICGGYQMMGTVVRDPHGVEGEPGESRGLGLLPVETELTPEKTLERVRGIWATNGQPVAGYEIHMGHTRCSREADGFEPAVTQLRKRGESAYATDGLRSADGRLWGTYLHGLFDSGVFRQAFLDNLAPGVVLGGGSAFSSVRVAPGEDFDAFKQRQYDLLGQHIEAHLDMDRIVEISGLRA